MDDRSHDADDRCPVIEVVEGDITPLRVDAIVNAANQWILGGGGVDGAIHRAGGPEIKAECRVLRETTLPNGLDTGAAVATTAGRLDARWVIHTVGPVYHPHEDRAQQLRDAYTRSLRLADHLGAKSIAFPLISGGAYGWPLPDAVAQQVGAIQSATVRLERILLVAFSPEVARLTRATLRTS